MLDMFIAFRVTVNCIREVGGLYPAWNHPIDVENDLISLRIDNTLVPTLVATIATDQRVGLKSLVPRYRINQNVFQIDETASVNDVYKIVRDNAQRY